MNRNLESDKQRRFPWGLPSASRVCRDFVLVATFLIAASPVLAVSSLEFEVTWTSFDSIKLGSASGTLSLSGGKFGGKLSSKHKVNLKGQLSGRSLEVNGSIMPNIVGTKWNPRNLRVEGLFESFIKVSTPRTCRTEQEQSED